MMKMSIERYIQILNFSRTKYKKNGLIYIKMLLVTITNVGGIGPNLVRTWWIRDEVFQWRLL